MLISLNRIMSSLSFKRSPSSKMPNDVNVKFHESVNTEYEISEKERTRLKSYSVTLKLSKQPSDQFCTASTSSSLSNIDTHSEETKQEIRPAVKVQLSSNTALTGTEIVKNGIFGGYLGN